jgi:hypothetical protein
VAVEGTARGQVGGAGPQGRAALQGVEGTQDTQGGEGEVLVGCDACAARFKHSLDGGAHLGVCAKDREGGGQVRRREWCHSIPCGVQKGWRGGEGRTEGREGGGEGGRGCGFLSSHAEDLVGCVVAGARVMRLPGFLRRPTFLPPFTLRHQYSSPPFPAHP